MEASSAIWNVLQISPADRGYSKRIQPPHELYILQSHEDVSAMKGSKNDSMFRHVINLFISSLHHLLAELDKKKSYTIQINIILVHNI